MFGINIKNYQLLHNIKNFLNNFLRFQSSGSMCRILPSSSFEIQGSSIDLSDIITKTLDTLDVFRSFKLWSMSGLPWPSYGSVTKLFSLANLHRHIHRPNLDLVNHHNALSDLNTLEVLIERCCSCDLVEETFMLAIEPHSIPDVKKAKCVSLSIAAIDSTTFDALSHC